MHIVVQPVCVVPARKILKGGVESNIPAEKVVVGQTQIHTYTRENVNIKYIAVSEIRLKNQRGERGKCGWVIIDGLSDPRVPAAFGSVITS